VNLITRLAAGLFALLGLAASLVTISLVTGGLPLERLSVLDALIGWLHGLPSLGTQAILGVVAGAGVVLLCSLLILYLQVTRRRGGGSMYLLREDSLGTFRIRKDAIAAIARHVGGEISGVEEVTCAASQNESGDLVLAARLQLRPVVDLVAAGRRFQETVKSAVEEKTGLSVATVDLETGYVRRRTAREGRRVVN